MNDGQDGFGWTREQGTSLMHASLAGLSVGDAFGDQFFLHTNRHLTAADLPAPFATHMDTGRRYGAGALELLERIRDGHPWRVASAESFGGNGSFGNGAAMRVAPLGPTTPVTQNAPPPRPPSKPRSPTPTP